MNIHDKLDDLIRSKKWSELNDEEKEFVMKELGSEETYHTIQKVEAGLETSRMTAVKPPAIVLSSLKKKFNEEYNSSAPPSFLSVIFYKTPAYATALLILMGLLAGWFSGNKSEAGQIAVKTVVQKDTVYISTKPDTIFVTKVVYRNIFPAQKDQVITVVKNTGNAEPDVAVGVSMKEKEELNNLLVSGSE